MASRCGRVQEIWRYPVKSFRGEQLTRAEITAMGLAGDRAYALRDRATGRVMSGKRFARLFECAARYPDGPSAPPEITLGDGRRLTLDRAAGALSAWLGREVEVVRTSADTAASYEIAIQTVDEIEAGVDQLAIDAGDFPCPPGSFFDAAPLHVLSDATLTALREAYPDGRFDVRRFRPNVLVAAEGEVGRVEEGWGGRTLTIGAVRVSVLMGTIRCVMTTLAQYDLPRDPGILRTVAREAGGNAGVYATIDRPGTISVGEPVALA